MDSGGCICALGNNSMTMTFKCGECNIGFAMICQLHQHLKSHVDDNGSYCFFFKTRVAFAEKSPENVSMLSNCSLKKQVKKGISTVQKQTNRNRHNQAQSIVKYEVNDLKRNDSVKHTEMYKSNNSSNLKLGKKMPDHTYIAISNKLIKEQTKQTMSLEPKSDHLNVLKTELGDISEKENHTESDLSKPSNSPQNKDIDVYIDIDQSESPNTDESNEMLIETNESEYANIVPKPKWRSVRSMGVGTIETIEPYKKRKRSQYVVPNTFGATMITLNDSESEAAEENEDGEVKNEPETSSDTVDDEINKDTANKQIDIDTELNTCNLCSKVFSNRRQMLLHRRVHKEYKTLQCHMCPASFNASREYKRHLHTHIDFRPFVCGVCDKRFPGERDLVLHKERMHMGLLKYQCEFCERGFTDGSSFKAHRATHFEPTLKCHFCEKKFRHRTTLIKHERTHSDTKYFQCHICDRGFNQCTPYFQHMDKTHDMNKRYLKDLMKCVAEARRREGLRLEMYRIPDDIEEIINKLRKEDEKEVSKDVGQREVMSVKSVAERVTIPATVVTAESVVAVEHSEPETQALPQTVLDEIAGVQGSSGAGKKENVVIYSVQDKDGDEQTANNYCIILDDP